MNLTEIAIRCKEGDRHSFGLLYQATCQAMRKVVLRYTENSDIADDILHDGYLVALTSIDTLKAPSKVEGWLATIMKNLALQELKARKHLAAEDVSNLEMADAEPYDSLDRRLSMEDLHRIMGDLPDGYGKVFRLSVLEGLSHREIGERLGIAPNSSSSQLFHAKTMMRRLVRQYSRRMGMVFALAVLIGSIWYVMMEVSPIMEKASHVSHGLAKENHAIKEKGESGLFGASTAQVAAMKFPAMTPKGTALALEESSDPTESISEEKSVGPKTENLDEARPSMKSEEKKNDFEVRDEVTMLVRSRTRKRGGWSFSAGCCSGSFDVESPFGRDMDYASGPPVGDPSAYEPVCYHTPKHHVPVVVELSVEKSISSRVSLETGLRYSYLRADYITEWPSLNLETQKQQRIHYIGVPLKLKLRLADFSRFSLYLQGGGAIDVPVYGEYRHLDYKLPSDVPFSETSERINAPVQWSLEGGLGLHYHLSPHVGLYVEPSLKYYFDTHSGIETIRQESPLNFAIPFGLRFSW